MSTNTDSADESPSASRMLARKRSAMRIFGGPTIGLVVMFIGLTLKSPYFLTVRNLGNILSQITDIGVLAAGATLVILIAGIDLSVAANMALTMMFTASLYADHHWPFVVTLIAGLLLGAFVGAINGLLATYGKVQPFVATLATMSACLGLALVITDGNTINGFPTWFVNFATVDLFGFLPLQAVIMMLIYLALAFWLRFRPGGRALYAIGGNEEVARLSGIPVLRMKTLVYMIAGALAAVAGWVDISTLDSAQPTAGANYLLNVIAVVVIGGASLSGGVGTMGSTFIGLLIIGVLNNGLSLTGVNPNLQPVVVGAVILAAVLTDRNARKAHG